MTETKKVETVYSRFIAAQAEIPNIVQSRVASAGRAGTYMYTDINAILSDVMPILNAHGLALNQKTTSDRETGTVTVETYVFDAEGASISSGELSVSYLELMQKGIQAVGSAITYARRYSLVAFLGIAYGFPDDDGQAAVASRPGTVAPVGTSGAAAVKAATERKPNELSVEGAKLFEQIHNATSLDTLQAVGRQVASSNLDAGEKALLRKEFSTKSATFRH